MSENRALRIRDVGAYLGVSHQRVTQMHAESKLPEPDRFDGIGPLWKPATIERWAEREWWGTRRWRKRSGRRLAPAPRSGTSEERRS